jgi:hypothetical protein
VWWIIKPHATSSYVTISFAPWISRATLGLSVFMYIVFLEKQCMDAALHPRADGPIGTQAKSIVLCKNQGNSSAAQRSMPLMARIQSLDLSTLSTPGIELCLAICSPLSNIAPQTTHPVGAFNEWRVGMDEETRGRVCPIHFYLLQILPRL